MGNRLAEVSGKVATIWWLRITLTTWSPTCPRRDDAARSPNHRPNAMSAAVKQPAAPQPVHCDSSRTAPPFGRDMPMKRTHNGDRQLYQTFKGTLRIAKEAGKLRCPDHPNLTAGISARQPSGIGIAKMAPLKKNPGERVKGWLRARQERAKSTAGSASRLSTRVGLCAPRTADGAALSKAKLTRRSSFWTIALSTLARPGLVAPNHPAWNAWTG
jgi:hypothetical protein